AETLYLHPYFWDKTSERTRGGFPFLFPICGRLERDGKMGAYLYDARLYTMPIHGFAMRMPWAVLNHTADRLTLGLRDTETTRRVYPFSFVLTLEFRIAPDAFAIGVRCENTGKGVLPYYAGFHPFFLTPMPGAGKEAVLLDFRPLRCLAYNERLTDLAGERALPACPLPVTDPAINETLTVVGAENETRLTYPDGKTLRIRAEGDEDPDLFAYLQFYTMPDRPFFCVEPWMAFPNALNAVAGARRLPPGAFESGTLTVRSA
ncbi:aldose epimerase, partial [Candidatus Uhrbacteria bacterium]|nr:aldose epimerase [Candidatus Uhrbacteria bacterium]